MPLTSIIQDSTVDIPIVYKTTRGRFWLKTLSPAFKISSLRVVLGKRRPRSVVANSDMVIDEFEL